jgi:hypothetical protein
MNNLPKILIIGAYTFEGDDATTITLRNLFENWDAKNIAFIHVMAETIQKKSKYSVFTLTKFIFGNIKINETKKSFINSVRASRSLMAGVQGVTKTSSLKISFLNTIHTFLAAHKALIPYKYSKELDDFVKQYQPDIIYSPMADIRIMQIINKISGKYKIPVIPHFMDDWQNTMYSQNSLLFFPRHILLSKLKKIIQRSSFGFTISQKMANEYSSKFNIPFYPFMNCVSDPFTDIKTKNRQISKPIKLCYSGGLHLNRALSLEVLCEVLKTMNTNNDFELSIFTKPADWELSRDALRRFDFVKYMGFVDPEEISGRLSTQDILVHVESFDPKIIKYTRLSISTKIPEYLSLAKPIIAIGPPDIASIEYLRSNHCALIIDNINQESVSSVLKDFFTDKMQFDKLSNTAYALFKKNHETKEQQSLLEEKLISALNRA